MGELGWVEAGFSWGGGLGEIRSVSSSIREWGMLLSVVVLRPCVVGGGIHALHWNMFS